MHLNLNYQSDTNSEDAIDDSAYAFLVMVKVTNMSDIPLYAYIDEANYDAPANSYTYKTQSYVSLSARNDSAYLTFAMALQDPSVPITDDTFNVPVKVTKDDANLPNPPPSLNLGTVTTYDATPVDVGTSSVQVVPSNEYVGGMYFGYLNFDYTPTGTETALTIIFSATINGELGVFDPSGDWIAEGIFGGVHCYGFSEVNKTLSSEDLFEIEIGGGANSTVNDNNTVVTITISRPLVLITVS